MIFSHVFERMAITISTNFVATESFLRVSLERQSEIKRFKKHMQIYTIVDINYKVIN